MKKKPYKTESEFIATGEALMDKKDIPNIKIVYDNINLMLAKMLRLLNKHLSL